MIALAINELMDGLTPTSHVQLGRRQQKAGLLIPDMICLESIKRTYSSIRNLSSAIRALLMDSISSSTLLNLRVTIATHCRCLTLLLAMENTGRDGTRTPGSYSGSQQQRGARRLPCQRGGESSRSHRLCDGSERSGARDVSNPRRRVSCVQLWSVACLDRMPVAGNRVIICEYLKDLAVVY
jgi:hypothetical protein